MSYPGGKPLWLIVLALAVLIDLFLALSWAQYRWIAHRLDTPAAIFELDFSRPGTAEAPLQFPRVPATGTLFILETTAPERLQTALASGEISLAWQFNGPGGRASAQGTIRPDTTFRRNGRDYPAEIRRGNDLQAQAGRLVLSVVAAPGATLPPLPGRLTVRPVFHHLTEIILINGIFLFLSLLATFAFGYLYIRALRRARAA